MQIQVNEKIMVSKTLFSEQQIKDRIKELAQKINQNFGSQEPLVVLIVLNGAFIFAADLVRYLVMPTEIETICLKSYEGTNSSGVVKLLTPLSENLEGKNILIVEDIVETGRSIDFLLSQLKAKKAKKVEVCALLNKPESHEIPMQIDYSGFDIGKNFVIGYGLDLDGRYRNLPYIAELMS
ncbi:MAG: hypoxanthine phosphoribosyltransferase [Bdellovibrionota bacterium]